MPSLMQRLGKSRTIALGSLCTAAGLVLIPLGRFLWSRLALPAPGVLFYVGSVTFVLGIALDMVNIPAQTVMQQQTPEEERGRVAQVPGSLSEALDALETDHEFLTRGGVFSEELIRTWIDWKRENEIDMVALRPHPAEFSLYFDA